MGFVVVTGLGAGVAAGGSVFFGWALSFLLP
jgi:hypothetical protein